ncbi:hypothetical protein MtrunA17_Chr7g0233291 [Medicago truncatula]|uniref:Uncharacterized protein n=1 Tax=Medicago truncatula TaxID=3880 RepID=A0A396H3V1_MEDTR|nr:hypothetical protein MtrunA17_Chr7g0233291 [Medicago truncatula]
MVQFLWSNTKILQLVGSMWSDAEIWFNSTCSNTIIESFWFRVHFELKSLHKVGADFLFSMRVLLVAQEAMSCTLLQSVRNKPDQVCGVMSLLVT